MSSFAPYSACVIPSCASRACGRIASAKREARLRVGVALGCQRLVARRHQPLELRVAGRGADRSERAARGLPVRVDRESLSVGRHRFGVLARVALRVAARDDREHLGQALGPSARRFCGLVVGLDAEHDVVLRDRDVRVAGRERFVPGGERTSDDLVRAREEPLADRGRFRVLRDRLREVVREERVVAARRERLVARPLVAAPRLRAQGLERLLLRQQVREQLLGLGLELLALLGRQLRHGGRLLGDGRRSRRLLRKVRAQQPRQNGEHEQHGDHEHAADQILPKRPAPRGWPLVERALRPYSRETRLDGYDGLFVLWLMGFQAGSRLIRVYGYLESGIALSFNDKPEPQILRHLRTRKVVLRAFRAPRARVARGSPPGHPRPPRGATPRLP